ncbi:MAG: GAF domain-containing protein [Acidobacteria bacterium]|nr:GAF domain-containing protein [Acidobacteriota bacterium]
MTAGLCSPHAPDEKHSTPESVDGRLVCLMRLVLSLSALAIIYVDPSEPDRLVAATYAALALYLLYSASLYLLASLRDAPVWERAAPWIDVAWYLVLVSLSSGTNSLFFLFFFFAVLVASFRQGFRAGLSLAVVSAALFTLVGFYTAPPEPRFEWNRFLLRPVSLFVLGYMMAYWGGRELKLKHELNLLRELSGLANPRFGLTHTLDSVMRRLRAFYDAESCLLVWAETAAAGHYLLTSARGAEGESAHVERIPAELAGLLRSLPEDVSVVYKGRRNARYFSRRLRGTVPFTSDSSRGARAEVEALAARLEAKSFITVPAYFRNNIVGRLYLTGRRGDFSDQDVEFLEQLVMQVAPVLDNIRLLERLAFSAAEQERQRLARDIHDSVIQPYLGLQYRLAAIRNRLAAGAADVSEELERLFESTVAEISGLRGFVRGLKDSDGRRADLAAAVRRFAAQFGADYDLDVRVEVGGRLNVNERLAAEVIRFVHEGLSNVRKHTSATRVTLTLGCGERDCFIRIENDGAALGSESPHAFTPRSLTERARELGGRVRVEPAGDGRTAVTVEIPL